jgi:hypothetical protein
MRSSLSKLIVAFTLLALAAACGGSTKVNESTNTTSSGGGKTSTSLFGFGNVTTTTPHFEQVSGLKVRFANFYTDANGKGAPLDVYWGLSPQYGKKIMTLEYGKVTDYMTGEKNPADPDQQSLPVSWTLEGKNGPQSVLMSQQEQLGAGDQVTFVTATSDMQTASSPNVSSQVITEKSSKGNQIDPPKAGKAAVYLNSLGVEHLGSGGGAYVTLGTTADPCMQTYVENGTGNGGAVYAFAPGTVKVQAYDANACNGKPAVTDPLELNLSAGDQVIVFAYGATKDARLLTSAKVAS